MCTFGGREVGVALRNRRQLEEGKGVESREKERGRRGGRETPKECSPIKSNRTQARLYPARLPRSRRPHRKLPAPPALTHTHYHSQSRQFAESEQRMAAPMWRMNGVWKRMAGVVLLCTLLLCSEY